MKFFTKSFIILVALFSIVNIAQSQISIEKKPLSDFNALSKIIPSKEMASVDVKTLLEEDKFESQFKDIPPRFGSPMTVNFGYTNSGTTEILADGSKVWRVSIKSTGAISINLIFNKFYMPKGASFFVYNKDRSHLIGAFTDINNSSNKLFSTAPVKGDEIILEYDAPSYVTEKPEINVSTVIHAYKNIFNFLQLKDYGGSGTCNRNVICPEGDPYRDQIRSAVMMMTSSNSRFCSGSMVNNARNDGTPFVLTANHCWDASSATWIVMFRYQSPDCPNPGADGPTNFTISGTTLCAKYASSDFCLVRLSSKPPVSYNAYYNGWNAINVPSTSGFGIHFPDCDVKKISFSTTPYTPTSYNSPTVPGDSSHWHVTWASIPSTGLTPITEPGSSGSPVYNQNKQVVGQLHGGPSSCTASDKSDYYGKFDRSWNGGGTPDSRLKDWLDSANTGILQIGGFDPNSGPLNTFNLQAPAAGVTITSIAGSNTQVTFDWDTASMAATYKWIFGSSLPTRLLTIPVQARPFSLTLGQLDVYLAGLGLAQGDSISGSWDSWSFRNNPPASDSLKSANGPRTIKLKRLKPVLAGFNLISPVPGTRILTQTGLTNPVNFVWNKSTAGVTYKWFYASPNFSAPGNIKFRFPANTSGTDSAYSNTISGFDALLTGIGLNQGDSSVGQWRVYAYSGSDSMASSQTNSVTFKRLTISNACIGTGTVAITNYPFNTYWWGNRTQVLYLASEVIANSGAAGYISRIGFNISVAASQPMNGFNINMQNTTNTTLTGFTSSGWTNVYTGTYTVPGTGWQYIDLQTPYYFNGTGNLLIEICYGNSSYTSATTVLGTNLAGMTYAEYHDQSTACTGFVAPTSYSVRPNACFVINTATNINNYSGNLPNTYKLSQNYPNPFNPVTRINYAIPKQGLVKIKVFDVLGREVQTLVNEVKTAGNYIIDFDGTNLSSGVYFYKLETNDFNDVKRMLLIK
jgi:hypothetical protein